MSRAKVHHYSLGYSVFGTNTTCKTRLTTSYLPTHLYPAVDSPAPPCPNPPKAQRVQNWLPSYCTVSTQGCPEVVQTTRRGSAQYGKGFPTLSTMATPRSRGERVPCHQWQQASLLGWRHETCPRRARWTRELSGPFRLCHSESLLPSSHFSLSSNCSSLCLITL